MQIGELAGTETQGVEALLGMILQGEDIAHDHVDLAGLLIDDLEEVVHRIILVAQQAGGHQIDGGDGRGDPKGLRQLSVQLLQWRQLKVGRHGDDIDRRGMSDAEELFLHGGYPLLS